MPGSHTGGGPPVVLSPPPLVVVDVVPSMTPVVEPGSPLLESGTTPEVVDASPVLDPGSPLVDVVTGAVVASVVEVGGIIVVPFDSEAPEGSVPLRLSLAPVVGPVLLLVVPLVDPTPVPVALPSPVPVPSLPQATRRRPRGAAQSDRRSCSTIPNMSVAYA